MRKETGALRIAHTESSINMGGQELRALEQIRWMLDHGHSSWLLARADSAVYAEGARRGLPVVDIPYRGSLHPAAVWKLASFVRRERVDIIECHSSRDASTALLARLLGTPLIRSQHICIRLKDDVFSRLLWKIGNDRIVTSSSSIADRVVCQGLGPRAKIDVVATGIDLDRFNPSVDGSSARQELGIPANAKVVSVIGMIRPDKRQDLLVRAVDKIVQRVPLAWFVFIGGPTRPEYLSNLQAEIARVANKDRIVLAGFRKDVECFMAASDVIAVLSYQEARSQVVQQAFAMRRLVVGANAGGIPELVADGETGLLFQPGDLDGMINVICRALESSTDTAGMVENAARIAPASLGLEAMMASMMTIYTRILARKRN